MKTFNETKSSGNPQPADQDYLKNDITSTEEVEMFDNGPESRSERESDGAVKGAAWLLGIFGVFAIAILIAWVIDMNHSPFSSLSSRSIPRQTATVKPVRSPSSSQFVATIVPVSELTITTQAPAPTANQSIKLVKNTNTKVMTKADQDRIEREALEVIHGDFGNNPGRKAKLGSDYAAVQAKVNQLLHI